MKLLANPFLLVLSLAAVRAQTAPAPATAAAPAAGFPLGGYYVVFPTVPSIAIHFDSSSSDIAKAFSAAHTASTAYNHDGGAFKGFVRLRPSESSDDNAVDSSEYRKNVKSGNWTQFVNGE
jgi:hypothetical protein